MKSVYMVGRNDLAALVVVVVVVSMTTLDLLLVVLVRVLERKRINLMFKLFKRKQKVVLPRENFKVHDLTQRKMRVVKPTKDNVTVLSLRHHSLAVNWDGSDYVDIGDLIHHKGSYYVVTDKKTVEAAELYRKYHVTVYYFFVDIEDHPIEKYKSKKFLDGLAKNHRKQYKIIRMTNE